MQRLGRSSILISQKDAERIQASVVSIGHCSWVNCARPNACRGLHRGLQSPCRLQFRVVHVVDGADTALAEGVARLDDARQMIVGVFGFVHDDVQLAVVRLGHVPPQGKVLLVLIRRVVRIDILVDKGGDIDIPIAIKDRTLFSFGRFLSQEKHQLIYVAEAGVRMGIFIIR